MSDAEKIRGVNPEKKNGKWTGRRLIDTMVRGQRFTGVRDSKQAGEDFVRYCRKHGHEPPSSPTFREIAERCERAGGPRGVWRDGRPPP